MATRENNDMIHPGAHSTSRVRLAVWQFFGGFFLIYFQKLLMISAVVGKDNYHGHI
jgi:hypothetical protein